jgi:hypothetical protein
MSVVVVAEWFACVACGAEIDAYPCMACQHRPSIPARLPWEPKPQPSTTPAAVAVRGLGSEYAVAALIREAGAVEMAAEGTRNTALNTAAFNLGQLVAGGALNEARVRAILTDTALAAGLTRQETDATITSGLRAGMAQPRGVPRAAPREEPPAEEPASRRVNLRPYLNGTWTPPEPDRGAHRDDGARLLYAGRWHTCIGPNESGKTWLGLVHARDELAAGGTVAWAHFEESDAGGTVARLLSLGVPASVILERFAWLDCDRAWTADEFTAELVDLTGVTLVGLDGINAACTRHGQDPEKPTAVGWYRRTFVRPATQLGAAVLSLGHPPKARDRQAERHGFGSTAWLDEVDGVGFRLIPGRSPIRRDQSGTASVYSVKDRYGGVTRRGTLDSREGWTYLGALVVDDTRGDGTVHARLSTPDKPVADQPAADEPLDRLAAAIAAALRPEGGGKARFDSERDLRAKLRVGKVPFSNDDLEPALVILERVGRLERDPYVRGRARGGWVLTDPQDQEEAGR